MAILVEAYQRILSVSSSPVDCTGSLVASFQKIDEKIRKNILGWIVKEVDDFCRAELQSELESLERFVSITGSA
jgi:hypothetical protein